MKFFSSALFADKYRRTIIELNHRKIKGKSGITNRRTNTVLIL